MSLINYKNLSPNFKNDLFSPFEQIFNEFYSDFFKSSSLDKIKSHGGYPKMDIISDNGKLIIRAAIPGIDPENVKVEMINDQTVQISGKMEDEYSKKDSSFFVNELSKRTFSRTVTLPYVLGDPHEAKAKNGILTLVWDNIKKQEPEPERRFIAIES